MNQGTESSSWLALFKRNHNSEKLPNKPAEQKTRSKDARVNEYFDDPDESRRTMNQGTDLSSWSALFKRNHNSEKLPNKPAEQTTRNKDARVNENIEDPDESRRKTDYSERDNYEYFNGKESCYGHYYLAEFRHNEHPFCCVAQYVTYMKAVLFKDFESAYEILRIRDPIRMANVGKQIRNVNKRTWRDNCLQLVKQGHREKFLQNPELLTQLINTHPKTLVEANPDEVLWGIGLDKHDELAWRKNTWKGSNLLGYILTEVRDELMVDKNLIEEDDRKVFLPELQKTLDTGEWYQHTRDDMSKDPKYLKDQTCNFGNCFPLWNQRERTQAPFTRHTHDQGNVNEELSSAKTDNSQVKTVTDLLTEQLAKPGLVLVKEKSRKKKKKERRKEKQKAKTREDVVTTTVHESDHDNQNDGQEGILKTSNGNDLKNNDNKEMCECRHWAIPQGSVLQGTYRENEQGELISENEIVIGELITGPDRTDNEHDQANNQNNSAMERMLGEEVLPSFDKKNKNGNRRNQLESTNDEAELQDYEVLEEEEEHIFEMKTQSRKENRPKPYVMAMLRETNLRLQNRRLQLEIEKLKLEVELLREQKKNNFKK